VPVVNADWLAACAAAQAALPATGEAHRLPPFEGLRICVTGVEQGAVRRPAAAQHLRLTASCTDERQSIKSRAEALGATYSSEMTKARCTHLIATSADSEKFRFATRWGTVKIVTPAWFERSIEAHGEHAVQRTSTAPDVSLPPACLDEAQFRVAELGTGAGQLPVPAPGAERQAHCR